MAFFQLTLKARRLEKMRLLYQDEKMRSIEVSKGAKIHYTLFQKIRHKKILLKMRFKKWLKKVTSCPEDSWFHEKAVLLRTDETFENYILKSVIGFCGGIFLTYLFFMFFVFQLNFTLSSATLLCSIFGVILTIGLAFSYRVRCVVFLLLPQFFSKRGRQALMAYAFILALTGPAKNTLHNMGVLSESLACGQEQLKAAVRTIVDLIKQPFYALRDSIAKVMKSIRVVVRKIKETLLAIKRIVLSILKVFKAAFQWLGSVMNICNKKLGTPFDRCQKVFDGAVADCKASLGPLFGGICNLAYVVSLLCWVVKPFDFICMLVSFISDSIIGVVKRKIKKFAKHVKAMFYVKVKFSHSFHFETNQSKSLEEVATGIVTEIRSRTDKFLTVFDWMSFATSFFFMFMMLRVIHYRHKWLTSERFDNRYLTDYLREIDLRRARLDKETVLPLNPRERNKYIPLTSITLIKAEKIKLTKSAVFLCLTTFKLGIHMMADYSLYWMLSTIRYHGRFESKVETPNSVGVYVSGNGFLADLYRSIVRAFSPLGTDVDIDTVPCLPDPIPPDLDRYTQIVSLIVFCWIMAIFEPYGLRLRHVVMCYYHPDRAKQRAVWLYNHIIRSRGSFLKFARRQLRRKFSKADKKGTTEKVTLKERLVAFFPILRHCLGADKRMCLLCGAVERESQPPLIKCPKPGCTGLFCIQCFSDLQNLCTICLEPIDYGDLSDMSEERDSSDGQVPLPCGQKLRDKLRQDALTKDERQTEKEVIEEEEGEEEEEEEECEEEEEEECEEEEDVSDECDEEDEDNDDNDDQEEKGSIAKTVTEEDQLDESESCSSSSTVYSYSYQDESPGEVDITKQRVPYKDVEAQKIRDDVTLQVFNDPLTEEESPVSEDLRDHEPRQQLKRKKDRKTTDRGKLAESLYDAQSTSSASIADTESLPTEEIDEEEIIQEEVSEGYEEEKLLSKKRKKRSKRRNRMRKIVTILSKPFLKKGCDRRCPARGIQKKKSSIFDRIVNIVQTKPSGHAECPKAAYRRLRRTELSAKPRVLTESSTDVEDAADVTDSSAKGALSSPHDLVELMSPRKYSPKLIDIQLPDVDRMGEIQHLEDSTSSGDNLYSKTYDSHRERRKKLRRKNCRKRKANKELETTAEYPHEKKFETKQLPRYLKPVIGDTKYDEINEREMYGTPRSDKEKESMNRLSDTKTTSSASSVHNMWNIKSADDSSNLCLCSKGSSLTSLDASPIPINKYELGMSTIEEGSDEFRLEEESFQTGSTDEIIDVTGVSSATSGVNLNKQNEHKEKKSIKRLVTPDDDSTDEETQPFKWRSKKARQEISVSMSEEKVQNIAQKPRKRRCVGKSKPKRPETKKRELMASAEPIDIVGEREYERARTDVDDTQVREKRKRRKRIDRSGESPGEKRPKKRVVEESREDVRREKPPKLYDAMAGLELFEDRPKMRQKKRREVFELGERPEEVDEKQYGVENKVESEKKKKKTKGSREITKKEKFGSIPKVFDFTGEKIAARNEQPSKLKKDAANTASPKTAARKVQTDFVNFEKKPAKGGIVHPRESESDASGTETTTETEESLELPNTDEFVDDYANIYKKDARRTKRRHAVLQKHRKSPRKCEKRHHKTRESYYTDPEDSPRRRDPESYRSTFSDEEVSPRRMFASEHRKLKRQYEGEDYSQEDMSRSRVRREPIERSQRVKKRSPGEHRGHDFAERMEERDGLPRNRSEHPNREDCSRRREYRSAERPGERLPPDYRPMRYPASGDSAPDHYEGRYSREYLPERNAYGYESGYRDGDRHRRNFPEDERRQRVRDMFESDYNRREYSHRDREPRGQYNPQQWAGYDEDGYLQSYDDGPGYGAEQMPEVPMYDPSSPITYDARTFPGEPATSRYPQRYPSPRTYPEGVDPYYGISSPPLNPYVPYNQPLHEQPLRYSPAEVTMDRSYPKEGVDQDYGLSSPTPKCCVPYDRLYGQPVTDKSTKIPPKSVKDNLRKSFLKAPILRRFLPIFQKPELIMELKEHDRIRLIQEREAKEKAHEFTQTTRVPMPIPTTQSTPDEENSNVEDLRPSSTSEDHPQNSEKRLPYQETEAFKEVLNEYEQHRSLNQPKRKFGDQENLAISSKQADASIDVTELYPPKGKRDDTMSRITSSVINAFSSKPNKSKPKKSSSQRVSELLAGPSKEVKQCQNQKCINKIRNKKQGRKVKAENPTEMSPTELSPLRRKNRLGQPAKGEEDEEDTTDNNETTREHISAVIMPHFVGRRKMKRQQFITTPSQVYNIYYTESVPVQQLPSITQNLTKSFPQLGLPASSTLRSRRTPRSNGLFRRNRNSLGEKNCDENLPYFPEEYHRKQIAAFAMNQLKAELYQTQNFEAQNPQNQTPFTEYGKNALMNYGKSIDLAANIEERYLRNIGTNNNSPLGSPTSVKSSLNSCNRGISNNSGQIITVPTQPMSSSQGYSMKIEVLAQPLKSDGRNPETLEEDFTRGCEVAEFVRERSVHPPQHAIAESKYALPVHEMLSQSTKSIPCTKKKKKQRMSLFSKIVRRIRRKSSQPDVGVQSKTAQMYFRENSAQSEVSTSMMKTPLISITGHQDGEGHSMASSPDSKNYTNDGKKSTKNQLYGAQEILSPRQMISSTTNMCSVKTDAQNTEPGAPNDKAFANKETTLPSEKVVNVVPSFQDVMAKLEETLSRYRCESEAERKLFTDVITEQLKQHGIKLDVCDQFVVELMEKERKGKESLKNTTTIEELSETESVNLIESQRSSRLEGQKKLRNENLPMAGNFTSRSHVSQVDEVMNLIRPSNPNTNCKSRALSTSYICGGCKCRNPPLLSARDEEYYSLKRESVKKDDNIPKDIGDDPCNWKALYERDVLQNSYLLFDANPQNVLNAYQDDHAEYQQWLKAHSRDRQSSCQECVDDGRTSSFRNLKSTDCSENLENSGHHSLCHRRRHRDHSPPERDTSSKSLHNNSRSYHSSANPSVSELEHVYFNPGVEARRYPQTANMTCCGLVMYGHDESAHSWVEGQCCHRMIPVCGTVSQGVSPRCEPNFMPPYHERDPCYSQRSHLRGKVRCSRHVHRTDETRKRHHHHQISEFEGEEVEEQSEANPKVIIDGGVSPPLMLRNLAKAANTVLATIFGRSTGGSPNQEHELQPYNRQPRSQDPVTISKNNRSTNDAMRRQQQEEQTPGHTLFNSQGN